MYLSRLEIQGFKSFAHTTSLDFQTGITAIVGPNGSGKSNVADAVRWVLGEQSLKLLRGKRSDDVIFAGSDKKSRLGVAEVSLFLNNEDRGAPIDYSELVISRRVFRDGQGEYLINRQPARLQDIQLLLARANFGQRTYSVIGQGMIDSFLISSPQERKHLFDEAAGVRQYQLKKDQALQKLARSKENLVQGEAIMAEIEPRLRSLTRQVRRLERREEVEKKLGGQQRLYFGLRWQEITQEQSQTKAEWTKHDSQRQGVAKELAAIQAELEGMERERSASEVFAGLQKEYNRILDQKNRLLQDQAIIKGQLEVAAKQAGRAENVYRQQRVEEVKRSLVSAEEELEVVEQLVKRAQTTLDKQSTELKQVDLRFNKIEEDLTKLSAGRQGTIWTMISATTKKIRQAFHALSTDLAGDAPNIEKLRQQSDRLNKDLENLSTQVESADEKDAAASLAEQQRALIDLSRERQRIVEHVAEARSELGRAEDQQQRLNDSRRLLQTEFDKLQKESSVIELAKTDPEAAYTVYVQQAQELEKKIAVVDEELKSARAAINNFNSSETSKKERLFALQKEFRDTQHRLNTITTLVNEVQVRLARLEQRQDDLRHEITQAMTAEAVTVIEAEANKELSGDITLLAEEIGHLQHQLQLIGGIDEQITEEYHSTNERWEFLNKQSEDLHAAITSLESAIAELDNVIKERFDQAFKRINNEFNTFFRTLFRGGRAELMLIKEVVPLPGEEDQDDEDEDEDGEAKAPKPEKVVKGEKVVTGIDIKATPPGKKLQSIAMLSGGERALTSIALLCAIISNNPSPFVALDEVDAALDEANSQRFAAILEQLAHKTQFITITHNRATMEKANILYGVTMGDDGISQLLSVKMDQAEEIIRRHGNR